MGWRGALALLLVLGLSGLRALAALSPPDPVWLPGLYDDADYDDVVQAALSLEGSRDDSPATLGRPTRLLMLVVTPAPPLLSPAPQRAYQSRAPPPPELVASRT